MEKTNGLKVPLQIFANTESFRPRNPGNRRLEAVFPADDIPPKKFLMGVGNV